MHRKRRAEKRADKLLTIPAYTLISWEAY
jgi:hypothetical protein